MDTKIDDIYAFLMACDIIENPNSESQSMKNVDNEMIDQNEKLQSKKNCCPCTREMFLGLQFKQ